MITDWAAFVILFDALHKNEPFCYLSVKQELLEFVLR
jgi:hypothetical protein